MGRHNKDVDEILGIAGQRAIVSKGRRTSRLAWLALLFGILSAAAGLISLACHPVHAGPLPEDMPDSLFLCIFLSAGTGALALVLAVAGLIRVSGSHGRFTGARSCLLAAGLAVCGNVIWLVVLGRAVT